MMNILKVFNNKNCEDVWLIFGGWDQSCHNMRNEYYTFELFSLQYAQFKLYIWLVLFTICANRNTQYTFDLFSLQFAQCILYIWIVPLTMCAMYVIHLTCSLYNMRNVYYTFELFSWCWTLWWLLPFAIAYNNITKHTNTWA